MRAKAARESRWCGGLGGAPGASMFEHFPTPLKHIVAITAAGGKIFQKRKPVRLAFVGARKELHDF
jgi:hypothetical protein